MKRFLLLLSVVLGGVVAAPSVWNVAFAATPGDQNVFARYGAVQVNTTATAVPAAPASGRNAVLLQNKGGASIYCAPDSLVTSSTGIEIIAGGSLSLDLGYNTTQDKGKIYCVAPSGLQVSPADTRWIEVR